MRPSRQECSARDLALRAHRATDPPSTGPAFVPGEDANRGQDSGLAWLAPGQFLVSGRTLVARNGSLVSDWTFSCGSRPEQATLWESRVEDCSLAICLNVTAPTYGQGELSLRLRANNADIYELCFVIAPAHLLGVDSDQVIFVTGLQGTKGCADLIKLATRSIGDVGPRLVLFAALQGIAMTLNIGHIVGISSAEQVSAAIKPPNSNFVSIYDDFWASIHAKRLASGCFQLAVPVPRKPLLLIRRNHRLRARDRRVVKDAVMNLVCEQLKSAVLLEPQISS